MTKLQYFQKNELSAYQIASGLYSWNRNDHVMEETTKILEEWYDDYLAEHV